MREGTNVLILEPHSGGHHGPYLEWMVWGLLERGFGVTILTTVQAVAHPSMQTLAEWAKRGGAGGGEAPRVIASSDKLSKKQHTGSGSSARRELRYWQLFKKWYETYAKIVRPDVVFLPYLDYCLYAFGLLGAPFKGTPWVGIAMRPSFHYGRMGVIAPDPSLARLKERLFLRIFQNQHLKCFLTIDESMVDYLETEVRATKWSFLPQPICFDHFPDCRDAKRQIGLAADRRMLLVYGALSSRKGIPELVSAIIHPAFPRDLDVVIAGEMVDRVTMDALNTPAAASLRNEGRLRFFDRFVGPDEEATFFSAADIVWLGYRGHYAPSGVLTQAVAAGCYVLACAEGMIGWQTKRYGLGQVVDPVNTDEVVRALMSLPNKERYLSRPGAHTVAWRLASVREAQDILARALY